MWVCLTLILRIDGLIIKSLIFENQNRNTCMLARLSFFVSYNDFVFCAHKVKI